jgi:protein-L-isoaspartate(D-aspartate) O-methyltransferase
MEPAAGPPQDDAGTEDAALARFIMTLRARGLSDPALMTAFERLPRAAFLPGFSPAQLYAPMALPLPCGEEASDPFTLLGHLRLLDVRPGHTVLEIGTGSGFLSAIMARLGARVTSCERWRTLLQKAERAFRASGITTVTPVHGDGLAPQELAARYDRIILNGVVETLPQHLTDRLGTGGRMLAHHRRGGQTQRVVWQRDITGVLHAEEAGPSRMGAMHSGIPACL